MEELNNIIMELEENIFLDNLIDELDKMLRNKTEIILDTN